MKYWKLKHLLRMCVCYLTLMVCIFSSVAEADGFSFTLFSGKAEDAVPYFMKGVETLVANAKECGASFMLSKSKKNNKERGVAWRITGKGNDNEIAFTLLDEIYDFENVSRYDTIYTVCYLLSSFFAYSEPAKALGYEMTITWQDENFTDGQATTIDRNNFRRYRENVIGQKLVNLMLSGGLNPSSKDPKETHLTAETPAPTATTMLFAEDDVTNNNVPEQLVAVYTEGLKNTIVWDVVDGARIYEVVRVDDGVYETIGVSQVQGEKSEQLIYNAHKSGTCTYKVYPLSEYSDIIRIVNRRGKKNTGVRPLNVSSLQVSVVSDGLLNIITWENIGNVWAYEVTRTGKDEADTLITRIKVPVNEQSIVYKDEVAKEGVYTYHIYPLVANYGAVTVKSQKGESKQYGSNKLDRNGALTVLTPTPSPTPKPTSAPITAPLKGYKKGDAGEEIGKIKARLQELGYYVYGAKCDDEFNSTMVERIKMFQKNNGLDISGEADVQTIEVLFGSAAIGSKKFATPTPRPTKTPKPTPTPYVEPKYPLEAPNADWGTTYGTPWLSVQIKNTSQKKTVDGFTMAFRAEDVYGTRIKYEGLSDTIEHTYNMTIKPGKTAWTEKLEFPGYSNPKRISGAIIKIHFTDGTTVSVPAYNWDWHVAAY